VTMKEEVLREWDRNATQAAELVEDGARRTGQVAGRKLAEVSRKLRETKERAASGYDRITVSAGRAVRGARDYAVQHPGATAAVTFGTGLALGMAIVRGREVQSYRRSLVPVVAIALANAALEVFSQRR
jgi:ElaB/YqjD/DUF883 family membrane-anchored ribosome-binding protein